MNSAEKAVSEAMHKLFLTVWITGRVPAEWKEGLIVSLYKGKGPHSVCSNYRPISLLSVPGKVFAHVLLARIQPLLINCRRPQQSGFTNGRSTIDAILALRLLAELHRAYNRPLHVAYIDIKSAFDSVDRVALWKALRGSGVPPFLLHLIQDLHTGTAARVRTQYGLSDIFHTSSGVRQGCILAPALFCCAIDCRLMRHCSCSFGVDVGSAHILRILITLMMQSCSRLIRITGPMCYTTLKHHLTPWDYTQTGLKPRFRMLVQEQLQTLST